MYHPTTRVLAVLELLQARGRLSGPELAERLEVDLRTVRRYVTMLQDLGIPVEAERGRHGGYRLRPGFRLPPLVFSDDEALALTLGLLSARRLGLVTSAATVEGRWPSSIASYRPTCAPACRRSRRRSPSTRRVVSHSGHHHGYDARGRSSGVPPRAHAL